MHKNLNGMLKKVRQRTCTFSFSAFKIYLKEHFCDIRENSELLISSGMIVKKYLRHLIMLSFTLMSFNISRLISSKTYLLLNHFILNHIILEGNLCKMKELKCKMISDNNNSDNYNKL